ncbi:MAG: aspartate kinase [Anaerolineae bacterium]|nr:aspartate kinase [Anaerolineae bacterium]
MSTLTMKFGGTSVGSPDAINGVVRIVAESVQQGNRVVVVVSAMAGVTDMLVTAVREAALGNRWVYLSTAQKIRDRHIEAANLLIPPGADRNAVIAEIEALMEQHVEICNAVSMLGESTPRINDAVFSFGERLSSRVIAAAMRGHGLRAQQFDASQFVITNDHFTSAVPIWEETESRIRGQLLPLIDDGITPVITGFVGGTRSGHFTTLGRGGSDYSGAIFAAYTDSDELVIWTDVDGVMTTDPRVDKRARVLPSISYQEVGELAFYGAKVLHPKTVQPILKRGIPMRVRNTFNTAHPGTLITKVAEPINTVIKAVTSIKNVSLLTVSGQGMMGVPGIAGRTFLATAHSGTSILMISQASSEQNFCFVVPQERAQMVKQSVESEMKAEIARQDVDGVDILNDVAVVTVVGAGMRGTPGVAGRVFSTLGSQRVNVIAIAQGASECSISFVISESEREQAVLALHALALDDGEAIPI